jgi:lysophospholipase L1-like esterase
VQVVVGTCPDLGALRAIAPPLRQVAGLLGRRMAKAQAEAVLEADGVVVDLGYETGAVFRADAGTLCYDGFHPSADGYRVWAHALYPAVEEAALAAAV